MVWKVKGTGYFVTLKRSKADQKTFKAGKTYRVGTRTRAEAVKLAKAHNGKVGYGSRSYYRFRKTTKKRRTPRFRLGFFRV
jgi:hypothetical protein